MPTKNHAGRPPGKRNAVLNELRNRIISGSFPPGSRLPVRAELGRLFAVSYVTVQHAVERLRSDGLVRATTHGTYVTDSPPHLCCYAMTFPNGPTEGRPWSRFWSTLQHSALGIQQATATQFSFYYGPDGLSNSPDCLRLLADAAQHRFAGIIFAGPPHAFATTGLLRQLDMPSVGVMMTPFHGIPAVYPDTTSFLGRAFDYLASQGRRRVAVIFESLSPGSADAVVATAREHGLVCHPHWVQVCPIQDALASTQVVRLLMRARGEELPDGLIIFDDNLVEYACMGLIAAGVRVPLDLEVVAHCNYPSPVPKILPVKRLGFDCGRIVRRCKEIIDMRRRGETPPPQTLVPAQFEEELDRHTEPASAV